MPDVRVESAELKTFLAAVFEKTGMPREDAEFSAWCTVQSDLWGIDSHGTLRFPDYEARLRKKVVNPAPKIVNKLNPELPIAHLEGDEGLGYVVARDGMKLAMEKARTFGISFVLASNSNHCGALGIYGRMAAEEGLLGICVTNVMPNVAMPGATAPVTGNNPIAMAAPIPGSPPFCIDVAMSMVAQGKLIYAAKKGARIPLGWATDRNGVDTDDPVEGIKGILMPTGMHKGFGISLFIDIITGLLGGGTFLNDIMSMYKRPDEASNLGHSFMAINPDMFLPREEFNTRMARWKEMIKATPVQPGRPPVVIPGEPEIETEKKRLASGITLPEKLWADLGKIAGMHGVELPTTKYTGRGPES